MSKTWTELGTVAPSELAAARLQIHHAAQLAGAFGRALATEQEGDAHANLGWDPEREALVSRPSAGSSALSVALRPADLTLSLVDDGGRTVTELALAGRTRDEGLAALRGAVDAAGLQGSRLTLETPYELPDHAVAHGEPFDVVGAPAFAEVSRWFDGAHALLTRVAESRDGSSEVRCWPHHFDIATLITLDPEADAESARSVGVGMTPGDGGIAVPYFYVTPWPYPPAESLPPLETAGRWNTEGWVGAVLEADALLAADDRRAAGDAFLDEAVDASMKALTHTRS